MEAISTNLETHQMIKSIEEVQTRRCWRKITEFTQKIAFDLKLSAKPLESTLLEAKSILEDIKQSIPPPN